MAIERVISGQSGGEGEEQFNYALRPRLLEECVGQDGVRQKLAIAIEAARKRGEPL